MLHCEVVKRAYVELRERAPYLKRLAFYTITEEAAGQFESHLDGPGIKRDIPREAAFEIY